jgi:hypothetical protein
LLALLRLLEVLQGDCLAGDFVLLSTAEEKPARMAA